MTNLESQRSVGGGDWILVPGTSDNREGNDPRKWGEERGARETDHPAVVRILAVGAVSLAVVIFLDLSLTWLGHRKAIASLADGIPAATAFMQQRAREGTPPQHWRWAPLDSLPVPVVCAVVAAENVRFFRHGSIDWTSQRAMLERISRGDLSRGGSSISQQLARNLFLSPKRTPRRKLREYLLAYQISHALSKQRQLELYINVVEWGDGVWGIAAGSEHLFARPLAELTPTEIVLLASVLPAPRRGLSYPLSPSRRSNWETLARILWREAVLDDLTWGATTARLRRMADFVDLGLTPGEAAAAVTVEMGAERVSEPDRWEPPLAPALQCDPNRRIIF